MLDIIQKIIDAISSLLSWFKTALQVILDFFAGLIGSIWAWLSDVALGFWDVLRTQIDRIWGWVITLLQSLWDDGTGWLLDKLYWVKDSIILHLGEFATWAQGQADNLGLTPTLDTMKTAVTTVAEFYGDAAWLLPMNGTIAIIASTFVLVGIVRLARWILSFLWITG